MSSEILEKAKEFYSGLRKVYCSEQTERPETSISGGPGKPERKIEDNPHIHTVYSDGHTSIYDVVAEAAALGFEHVGPSDHWDPLSLSDGNYNQKYIDKRFNHAIEDRRKAIESVLEDNYKSNMPEENFTNISISEGAELDYFQGYERDLEKEIEDSGLDYVVISVHMDEDANDYCKRDPSTKREAENIIDQYFEDIESAVNFADAVGKIKMLCHPDRIETNRRIKDVFGSEEDYNNVLSRNYRELLDQASNNDVLPELNGRILVRNGDTNWIDVLTDSDIDYTTGTDSHRSGVKRDKYGKPKYPWKNETQARINLLEQKAPDIENRRKNLLNDVESRNFCVPKCLRGSIQLDSDPVSDLP